MMDATFKHNNNNSSPLKLSKDEALHAIKFNSIHIHDEPPFEALKMLHNDIAERINNAQNVFSNFGDSIRILSGKIRKRKHFEHC